MLNEQEVTFIQVWSHCSSVIPQAVAHHEGEISVVTDSLAVLFSAALKTNIQEEKKQY